MSDQYDSYAPPPPLPMPESYTPPEPMPVAEPMAAPEESVAALAGGAAAPTDGRLAIEGGSLRMERVVEELVAWLKTLASAAVYATLIVTFGFQVARVEGHSMAPTLSDQDRLIVNKLAYRLGEPHIGDIVMLYYPNDPNKSFVKRVIAEEGDQVRIVDGKVYRNDILLDDFRNAKLAQCFCGALDCGSGRLLPRRRASADQFDNAIKALGHKVPFH